MIVATDLKNGTAFLFESKPYQVVKYSHSKIGRGGANVKVSARNLEDGSLVERTFNSTDKFENISVQKKKMQYLYQDNDSAYFMDSNTYQQTEIDKEVLGDDINYVKEGENANVLFWGDKALSVEIPPKVILEVTETTPGVKGNSATNVFKEAKLENGLTAKIPLFINKGEKVVIDTRTGSYVERAK